jgi:3-oxoacyl-[acyl-carrier-protein] synthase-1
VYNDMNGEPYRADEFGFTGLRTKESFEALSDFVAPADCWGDVGSAGALLHVVLAAIAGKKRYARGEISLLSASSDGGERAAAVLRIPLND